MPVTNAALLSQIHLSGDCPCLEFAPNPFRPNICSSCSKLISKHSPAAIPSDDVLMRAIEYSQAGEKAPSCILQSGDPVAGWGGLYHGGFRAVTNTQFLRDAGITHIVNTAKGLDIFGPKYSDAVRRAEADLGILFLELDWEDTTSFTIPQEDLVRSSKFIHAGRAKGGSVLVHCAQGKSRSATAVVAYMMASRSVSFGEALSIVQEQRKMAEPNPTFAELLKRFERSDSLTRLQRELQSQ